MTFFILLIGLFLIFLILLGRMATREYDEISRRYKTPTSE